MLVFLLFVRSLSVAADVNRYASTYGARCLGDMPLTSGKKRRVGVLTFELVGIRTFTHEEKVLHGNGYRYICGVEKVVEVSLKSRAVSAACWNILLEAGAPLCVFLSSFLPFSLPYLP